MHLSDFHRVTFDDKEWIDNYLEIDPQEIANLSFATNFIWGDSALRPEVARLFDCGVYRCLRPDGSPYFTFPFGPGDKKALLDALREACRTAGSPFTLAMLSDAQARQLQAFYPGEFLLTDDRDMADYVYAVSDLATLKGSRYQPKRNHVRRFKAAAPWSYEPLSPTNVCDCNAILEAWTAEKAAEGFEEMDEVRDEATAIRLSLDNLQALDCFGGLLRQEGRAVAFTLGERLNGDTAVAHFEKAHVEVEGAFQTINQEFAAWLAQQGFSYVNREEDTGLPNLRKAKMSYHPCHLVRKFTACASEIVSAGPADYDDIARLWSEAFGDEEAFIRLFLEKRLDPDSFLLIHDKGQLVAMGAFLPAEVRNGDDRHPVRYVYALATAKDQRECGYATRLLDFASAHYNVPLVLVPQKDELVDFYVNRGFKEAFTPETWSLSTDGSEVSVTFRKTDARILLHRRDEVASGPFLYWDETAVAFAIEAAIVSGGEALETDHGETVLYERCGPDAIRIIEAVIPLERRRDVIEALLSRTGAQTATYRNAGGMIRLPQGQPFPSVTGGYLNLALD